MLQMPNLTETDKKLDRIVGKGIISDMKFFALLMAVSCLLRSAISIGPYSGQSRPPFPHMHKRVQKWGDFECHRLWMEVTTNLDTTQWYEDT